MTRGPLPRPTAWRAVLRCLAVSTAMLVRGEVRLPRGSVGRRIRFADGSIAPVYRETVVARAAAEPCVLVVSFRLRGVRGRGHRLFRWESLANIPLFVGFPGFVSKLWLAHDARGTYRGLYEWDGADRAESYARSLWRVLELVSEGGSVDFVVLPGLRRDALLAEPAVLAGRQPDEPDAWWRVVAAGSGTSPWSCSQSSTGSCHRYRL